MTVDQQATIAHWIIEVLQNPHLSLLNSNYTCGHPHWTTENHERDAHGKYGDLGNGPEYEQGPEAGDGTDTNGKEGKTDSKGIAHQDDGDDNPGPSDEAYSEQTSECAGTTLDEEDPSEGSQVAICPEDRDPLQEDIGTFDLLDVCIALAKDNLDERRMQRLRAGFFGLLNQTL